MGSPQATKLGGSSDFEEMKSEQAWGYSTPTHMDSSSSWGLQRVITSFLSEVQPSTYKCERLLRHPGTCSE